MVLRRRFAMITTFSLAKIFEMWVVEKFVSPKTMKKFGYLVGHEGVILSFLLFFDSGISKRCSLLYLGSDTDAIRDFSDYFHYRKDTRDIDGNAPGRKGLRSPIQALFDPVRTIRTGNVSLLDLP